MISNSPLEKNIKQLQQYVNDSIDAKYRDYSFSYSVKYSYLTEQQKKSVTELEIEEFSNKLMLFVRDNRVLKQIIPMLVITLTCYCSSYRFKYSRFS